MMPNSEGTWPTGSAPYRAQIQQAATANDVPVMLLAWLLWKESSFLPEVINGSRISRTGAMGIAQFMPATAHEVLGSVEAALDPSRAIPGAARYLAGLYQRTGNWSSALAAYNWGIGNVLRGDMMHVPAETVDYVSSILSHSGISDSRVS